MQEFIKLGGTYKSHLRKMYHHKFYVNQLSATLWTEMYYAFFHHYPGVRVWEVDYSEKYQLLPMREFQSENFGKDTDVLMEIRIVSLQKIDSHDSQPSQSNEKSKDDATRLQNILLIQ